MDLEASKRLMAIAEAAIFASPDPLPLPDLARVLGTDVEVAGEVVSRLQAWYGEDRGIQLVEVAGGFHLVTRPEYAPYLSRLSRSRRPPSLSQASLQTLAVIAYKQPVTRAEIEQIRGVNVEGVLASLLDRGLICEAGHRKAPGKPILYATTQEFLRYFGLRSLDELPPLEEFLPDDKGK